MIGLCIDAGLIQSRRLPERLVYRITGYCYVSRIVITVIAVFVTHVHMESVGTI